MKMDRLSLAAFAAVVACFAGCKPDDGLGDLAEGRAAYEARDLRKAEKCLEASYAASATNVDALVYLARVKLDLGQLSEARKYVGKAAELAGADIDVRLLSAQIAWHAKDYAAASAAFAAIAKDEKLGVEIRAEGWTGVGIVEMTCNNRDLARIAFLRAVRLDRRNAAAWYHLGLLYRDSFGYPWAALEQFNIYVRLDGEASPRVQKVQRAFIPELKESIARSATDIPGAHRRDSAASAAAISKAEEAWKKGNFKTARLQYQEAVKADALSYPAALGLAKAWLKTDATRNGQLKALDCYRQACVLRPGAISTYLTTGDLCARLGQNAQAVEIYSRAVAADPASPAALDGLIRSLRKTGTKEKAKIAQAYQLYRDSLTPPKKK